jgi:CheY-like chemotaxis protein
MLCALPSDKPSRLPRPLLIVEDDEVIEFALADMVTDCGYRTVAARNGVEALEVLRRERPWLILTDLVMPKMDGYAFLNALRADPALAPIPILVVTGSTRLDREALAGVPVFGKPIDTEALMAAIRARAPVTP